MPSDSAASASVTQTGGTFKVDGQLLVAGTSATDAVYDLSGGTLDAGSLLIANNGMGTLAQSGGTIAVAGTAYMGWYGSGATWTMTGGTDSFGALNFGDWSGGTSTWTMSGGSVAVTGASWAPPCTTSPAASYTAGTST